MKKVKQITAIICIFVLVGMYIATLILAICDSSASMGMFKGCIICTIFVPVAAYCYICLHKYAMNRSGRKDYYTSDNNTDNIQDSNTDDTQNSSAD